MTGSPIVCSVLATAAALLIAIVGGAVTSRNDVVNRAKNTATTASCADAPYSGYAYCNASLPLTARLADLVERIPRNQSHVLMSNTAAAVVTDAVAIPAYQWWSEGLHGVAFSPGVNYDGPAHNTTSFPQVCTTAATWDRDLFTRIGETIGTEGRAMNNLGQAGLTFYAPNINIYRDPRWGRGQETPGEDPYLTSVYAMHFVSAMQRNDTVDPNHLRVSATCKHFLGYDLENWGGLSRFTFDAVISDYDMARTYLPAFEACMHQDGGAASGAMCSYNSVNGVPSCANPMMDSVARAEFGFRGYFTSDCWATKYVQTKHHYTTTAWQTLADIFSAGEDISCDIGEQYIVVNLPAAMANGSVPYAPLVTKALADQFDVMMRLGNFDPAASQPYKALGVDDIDTKAARDLALEVAEAGIVLLENYNEVLPLTAASTLGTVAVIGPNAASSAVMLGNYFGKPPYAVSVLQGIQSRGKAAGFNVTYAAGLPSVTSDDISGFAEACAAANVADVVILAVGNDQTVEAEGHDRASIAFPGAQDLLVQHVLDNCLKPAAITAVVTLSGGSVDYSPWNQHPRLGGLLWAGYPGQSGGTAITNVLFGDVSPSGRLPHTVYPASYAEAVMMSNMTMQSDPATAYPGRTYKYYVGRPVYPFGWMRTYTRFNVSILSGMRDVVSASRDILPRARPHLTLPMTTPTNTLVMNVSNVGPVAGAVSMVLKVSQLNGFPDVGGEVVDFQKINLKPGQWQVVTLYSHLHASLDHATPHPKSRTVRFGHYRWSLLTLGGGGDSEAGAEEPGLGGGFDIIA